MNLIFDYDGTLHNTVVTYAPAFRKAFDYLVESGFSEPADFTDKEISYWLGYPGVEMWKMFKPDLSEEIHENCRNIISGEMKILLGNGLAELYDGAKDVLEELSREHALIFLSNCMAKYAKRHIKHFGLDRYFKGVYAAEDYGYIPKHEIFKKFKNEYTGGFIMIGDRHHDMEVAAVNGFPSIGCGYGYAAEGELNNADIIVGNIKEIPAAVRKLCAKL